MKYKLAFQYATYREYCVDRAAHGLQVIPEKLWNSLKNDQEAA